MELVRSLGRYQIRGLVGRGAAGEVYLAHDPLIERRVALKTLSRQLVPGHDDQVRERFLREARAAGGLSHPNIVTIFDVGEDPASSTAFIAMEFIEGRTLKEIAAGEGRLDAGRVVEIGAALASALDYAHREGVIHRDVKPANIMVTDKGGVVKITDFGIAHLAAVDVGEEDSAFGTPFYMSPEQIRGLPLDGRTDVYSLGVVLFELLVGHHPFPERTLADLARAILERPAPEPAALCPQVPAELSEVVARCLEKRPEDRFGSGRDLVAALVGALPTGSGNLELDSTFKRSPAARPREGRGTLRLVEAARQVHVRAGRELLIGRDDSCDVRLGDSRVSRKHAVVSLAGGDAALTDLASCNGCTRNGDPIVGTILLNHGDVVGIGGAVELAVRLRERGGTVEAVSVASGADEFLLTRNEVVVGSDPKQADVVVGDEGVSAVSARIEFLFDAAILSGERRGEPILVDGKPTSSLRLEPGIGFRIGRTLMTWEAVEPG